MTAHEWLAVRKRPLASKSFFQLIGRIDIRFPLSRTLFRLRCASLRHCHQPTTTITSSTAEGWSIVEWAAFREPAYVLFAVLMVLIF